MTDLTKSSELPMPLEGIKVVEYGVFHAGPGGMAILADLGAEVIKVEAGIGDPERYWTKIGGLDMTMSNGESFMFEVSNRGKKGIFLDIKTPKGREIFDRLVSEADVFMTNLRKSTKEKLAIDYPAISKLNPKIIHASVSGYGLEGPMNNLGAFDPLGLARSGMTFITGSEHPRLIHLGVLDQATAIALSHAVLTALLVRERQGIGQAVHVSLYSTALWLVYCNLMLINGMSLDPTAAGERQYHSPLRNAFLCQDGKWILGTHHPEDRYWPAFVKATGTEHILEDPRFADAASRQANCPELVAFYDKVFQTRTRDEWMEIFLQNQLMFSSVQTIPEIADDVQALANDYLVPFENSRIGNFLIPGYPVHFSASRAGTRAEAPALGQHTDEVLAGMGFSAEEIKALKEEGIAK